MIDDSTRISWTLGNVVAAAILLVAVPSALAADGPPPALVQVVYVTPDQFTDVGDNGYVTTDQRRDALLAQLKGHIEKRAAPRIPAGSTLTVTITDIDMAGGFEGSRGPRLDRVRIVKDVYPPRIRLTFKLADSAGKVIAESRRELTDLAFMTSLEYRGDLLRHEKKLIDDWIAREFPGPASRHAENR